MIYLSILIFLSFYFTEKGGIAKASIVAISTLDIIASSASIGLSALFGMGLPFILPVGGTLVGLAALYLSVSFAFSKKRDGYSFKNELKIIQTLDKIIQNAVRNFDNQQFKEFFVALSESFDKIGKEDVSLITCNFKKEKFKIESKEIIYNMHMHGFKPEAIAYLINMIFESLLAVLFDQELNKDFSKMRVSDSTIKATIEDLLDSVSKKQKVSGNQDQKNEINLEEEAEKLDNKLRELQSRIIIDDESLFGRARNYWHRFRSYISSQGIIDDEMIRTGKEITFKTRFNEVRNIAKINKVIYFLIVENNETILEKAIEDIQETFAEFHYISKAYLRFEVLKDFIWLFTGDALLKEKLQEDVEISTQATFENLLKNVTDDKLRKDLKGALDDIVRKEESVNSEKYKFLPIKRMTSWIEIKKKYEDARNFTVEGDLYVQINMGYARACLNLAKYSKLIEFIKSNKANAALIRNPEFWLLGSMAHRRQFKYDQADKFIEHSLNLVPNDNKLSHESDLIQKFKSTNPVNYVKQRSRFKENINLDEDYYAKMHNEKKVNYNILSIDGGGL